MSSSLLPRVRVSDSLRIEGFVSVKGTGAHRAKVWCRPRSLPILVTAWPGEEESGFVGLAFMASHYRKVGGVLKLSDLPRDNFSSDSWNEVVSWLKRKARMGKL